MPRCTVCNKLFHPDWVISVDDKVFKCLFCQADRKELTVEEEGTGKPLYTVTKEQAIKDYDVYLKKIMEKNNVQDIIRGINPHERRIITKF